MDLVLAFLSSLIPALLTYYFLRKRNPGKPGYREDCKKAFVNGMKSTLLVVPSALVLNIIAGLTGLMDINVFVEQFIKDVILAALLEEVFKMRAFLKVLKESECEYSWLDVTAYMVLAGLGFETLESIVYTLSSGAIQMIIRGLTMMHGMFGLIMGYYYGKGLYTGKKIWFVLSFLLPFLYHGTYDFMLSDEFRDMGDIFSFVPVILAFLSLVLVFVMIIFFRRNRDAEMYNVSLRPAAEPAPLTDMPQELPVQVQAQTDRELPEIENPSLRKER